MNNEKTRTIIDSVDELNTLVVDIYESLNDLNKALYSEELKPLPEVDVSCMSDDINKIVLFSEKCKDAIIQISERLGLK